MLYLMDIEVPNEMNGQSLVTLIKDVETQEQ
jgi:hypothetical protein